MTSVSAIANVSLWIYPLQKPLQSWLQIVAHSSVTTYVSGFLRFSFHSTCYLASEMILVLIKFRLPWFSLSSRLSPLLLFHLLFPPASVYRFCFISSFDHKSLITEPNFWVKKSVFSAPSCKHLKNYIYSWPQFHHQCQHIL